ncbi:metal-dependent hydrolase [Fodinicola feengrottensis]|uniref:Metal-dependent hydrolase n=1 Tax=Fodinicola feengrottensis TaxID=435914 RepID=A0ABN2G4S2_9ACTN
MTAYEHDDIAPQNLVLQPRDVHFDWSELPMHWVPDEPMATHVMNVLHLLLPEGERWFVRLFQEVVPRIHDDTLREQVLGFIGQEAVHAEAHSEVLDHLLAKGLDPRPFTQRAEWIFRRMLGDREGLSGKAAEQYLLERVAIVAAIEHFTAHMGHWMLNAKALDEAGIDPTMLDLLRWHAAEEVEHRAVAYDLARHLDRRYMRRARAMIVVAPLMGVIWLRGTRFMIANDPELRGLPAPDRKRKIGWRALRRAGKRGLLPRPRELGGAALTYLKPKFHPSQEYSTSQAVAYLASSQAARAAH